MIRSAYQWQLLNADGSPNQYSNSSSTTSPTYIASGKLLAGNYEAKLTATVGTLSPVTATFGFTVDADPSLNNSNNLSWATIPYAPVQRYSAPDAIIQQPNGQIIIAGAEHGEATTASGDTEYAYIARLNPDLSLDTSFGPQDVFNEYPPPDFGVYGQDQSGLVTVPFAVPGTAPGPTSHIFALAINPINQDIIAVGMTTAGGGSLGVAEYVGVNRVDTTPGSPYYGKILLAGTPDPDFNGGDAFVLPGTGYTRIGGWAVAVQSNHNQSDYGSIYVGGVVETAYAGSNSDFTGYGIQDFLLLRLNQNGILDTTFNGTGFAQQAIATGLQAAAPFNSSQGIPLLVYDEVAAGITSLELLPNGEILAGGYADRGDPYAGELDVGFVIARYTEDGVLDTSFGADRRDSAPDGETFTSSTQFNASGVSGRAVLSSMATLSTNGDILAVGESYAGTGPGSPAYIVLAEYNSDGIPVSSYGSGGVFRTQLVDVGNDESEFADVFFSQSNSEWRRDTGAFEVESNGQIIGSIETGFPPPNGDWIIVDITGDDGNSADVGNYTTEANLTSTLPLAELNNTLSAPVPADLSNAVLVTSNGIIATGLMDIGYQNGNIEYGPFTEPFVVRYYGATPPVAPAATNLRVSAGADGVSLTWSNSGFGQDGFEIERTGGGAVNSIIATVGANQEDYVDTTVSADTTYSYEIIPVYTNVSGSVVAGTPTSPFSVHTLPTLTSNYKLQEILQVPFNGEVHSATPLQSDVTYLVVALGSVTLPGVSSTYSSTGLTFTDASQNITEDAGYWYSSANPQLLGTSLYDTTGTAATFTGVAIGDYVPNTSPQPPTSVPDWGTPNGSGHYYTMAYVGDGSQLNFQMSGPASIPGSVGSQAPNQPIQAEIFALPSVYQAPPPPPPPSGEPQLGISVPSANGGVIPAVLGVARSYRYRG